MWLQQGSRFYVAFYYNIIEITIKTTTINTDYVDSL